MSTLHSSSSLPSSTTTRPLTMPILESNSLTTQAVNSLIPSITHIPPFLPVQSIPSVPCQANYLNEAIGNLSNMIDDVKDKLSNEEFKSTIECVQEIYKAAQSDKFYRVEMKYSQVDTKSNCGGCDGREKYHEDTCHNDSLVSHTKIIHFVSRMNSKVAEDLEDLEPLLTQQKKITSTFDLVLARSLFFDVKTVLEEIQFQTKRVLRSGKALRVAFEVDSATFTIQLCNSDDVVPHLVLEEEDTSDESSSEDG
ncbi:MAG: hypothetical protein Sylvanvirus26_14 [Sylvanvirus sp.]|uniref:Uncharacterized protein n=1 Tax=Sylvanvirus sp. TaxID=2487774 RepID=A0A3G5AJT6_9VIRU|nr:MAG: hypothetical protein Sylvanvirus26_14 [Sylvanvirus sp.]